LGQDDSAGLAWSDMARVRRAWSCAPCMALLLLVWLVLLALLLP